MTPTGIEGKPANDAAAGDFPAIVTSSPDDVGGTERISEGAAVASADLACPNPEPTDGEIESAIVMLTATLRARRESKAGNVVRLVQKVS